MLRNALIKLISISLVVGSLGVTWQPAQTKQANDSTGKTKIILSYVNLPTNDIIFDPISEKIYASTPWFTSVYSNSIVSIDVPSGTLGSPIFVGNGPNKLAISADSQFLYVGLDSEGAVRRFNIETQTPEIQFSLGSVPNGAILAQDMVVLPGNPHTVAVSLWDTRSEPHHYGVAIYDDGVRRPVTTPGHTGSNVIEPSATASFLYGHNNETSEFGFRIMSVISTGVVVELVTTGLINRFYKDIVYHDGLVYATTGAVIDPSTKTLKGTYAGSGTVCPDSQAGRVYFLQPDTTYGTTADFKLFDQNTYQLLASFTIFGLPSYPSRLIKVGENLLAFRTSTDVIFIQIVELNKYTHLPYLVSTIAPVGIWGRMTHNGAPVANETVELRFYTSGTGWITRVSTTTNVNGIYVFSDVPSLSSGYYYYVRYRNTSGTPGRLWAWFTRLLDYYQTGSNVMIGEFDIADVHLVSPAGGAAVALPYTFQWMRRSATPSDNYEFDMYDPADGNPYFYTNPRLGYVDAFTLTGLPTGFINGVKYAWEVWVYGPDGGYGISYETRTVKFYNAGLNLITTPQPEQLNRMLDRENRALR